jgi:hypothetical protein
MNVGKSVPGKRTLDVSNCRRIEYIRIDNNRLRRPLNLQHKNVALFKHSRGISGKLICWRTEAAKVLLVGWLIHRG